MASKAAGDRQRLDEGIPEARVGGTRAIGIGRRSAIGDIYSAPRWAIAGTRIGESSRTGKRRSRISEYVRISAGFLEPVEWADWWISEEGRARRHRRGHPNDGCVRGCVCARTVRQAAIRLTRCRSVAAWGSLARAGMQIFGYE